MNAKLSKLANASPMVLLKGDLAIVAHQFKLMKDKFEASLGRHSGFDAPLAIAFDRANNPLPEYEVLEKENKLLQMVEIATKKMLLESGKADGMVAALLSYLGSTNQPSEDWLKAFAGQREQMWRADSAVRIAISDTGLGKWSETPEALKLKERVEKFSAAHPYPNNNLKAKADSAFELPQIDLPEVGCVLGMPYPDWPDNLTTFPDRKAYQLGVAHGKAVQNHQDEQSAEQLITVLVQAIGSSGFSVSGPTDVRAAEHGEPTWVCNARSAIAEYGGANIGCRGDVMQKEFKSGISASYDHSYSLAVDAACQQKESCTPARGNEARAYGGKVIEVTEHHVAQSIGKTAVIHHKANLDQVPEKDEMINIVYDGKGQGKVDPRVKAQNKCQSK